MSIIRNASSVIVTREQGSGTEIYLVQRAPQLRFMGGYWAFPGGTVVAEDKLPGNETEAVTFSRCAVRELFEETGLLPASLAQDVDGAAKKRIRQELLNESSLDSWLQLLSEGHDPHDEFSPVCIITTPPFSPVRYKTCFLHIPLPDGAVPVIETGELVQGRFYQPAAAVEAWDRGEINIAPPNLFLLRLMAQYNFPAFKKAAAAAARKFDAGALHPVYFSPGIFLAPQRTPTLPPATTTNTLIVGTDRLYVVEPASPEPEEQEHLFRKMDELIAAGKKFEAILLTHYHIDHVGAVNAVSRRYQLPVRAHPLTYERIAKGYIKGTPLPEGDRIELGTAPDGTTDWHLTVIHTPGHARDHICYLESRYHTALVGDMLSTISTILIDPPEGHMRTYLESLERLLEYPIRTLFPSHGTVHNDGAALIRNYLVHRKERENAIIEALDNDGNSQSLEELVPVVYADVDESFHDIAARSLLAGLIKLEEDGICKQGLHGWHLAGA